MHGAGDLLACGIDIGKIGRILTFAGGGAYGDQNHVGLGHGILEVLGEDQAAGLPIGSNDGLESLLIDRDLPLSSIATFRASRSTQVTSYPKSEKQAAETSPT